RLTQFAQLPKIEGGAFGNVPNQGAQQHPVCMDGELLGTQYTGVGRVVRRIEIRHRYLPVAIVLGQVAVGIRRDQEPAAKKVARHQPEGGIVPSDLDAAMPYDVRFTVVNEYVDVGSVD